MILDDGGDATMLRAVGREVGKAARVLANPRMRKKSNSSVP